MIRRVRRLPSYAWIGLLLMVVSEAGMLAGVKPFASWHTPVAWTGYLLLVDGLVWKRRGNSWIRNSPAELVFLAVVSVPLWVVFEMYNKYSINNWHYVGLPDTLSLRYVGYAWAFATIWPAIFETAELVSTFRRTGAGRQGLQPRGPLPLTPLAVASIAAGAIMLIVPIVYPSTYLAAPVWLGFIFLLDPLNARAGAESILGDWRRGHHVRLINLMAAGLVCGLVWEFWNYWAHTKWVYTVPILPEIKLFEMPILGFAGFPAFAVECFVMYVAVRAVLWTGAARPSGI